MEKGLIERTRKKDNEAITEIIQLSERKAYKMVPIRRTTT